MRVYGFGEGSARDLRGTALRFRMRSLRRRILSGVPRIDNRQSGGFEVADIARDDCEIVFKSGCRKEAVNNCERPSSLARARRAAHRSAIDLLTGRTRPEPQR